MATLVPVAEHDAAQVADTAALLAKLRAFPRRITADSRRIEPGVAFAAYPGTHADGRKFVPDAIARGATAVLWESAGFAWDRGWQVPHLPVEGLQGRLGAIADFIYGSPSQALWMVGVTGTNGKTSCAHWIGHAFDACGRRAGILGTLGNGLVGALAPATHTTPDAPALHELLAAVPDGGRDNRGDGSFVARSASRGASAASSSTSRSSPTSRATTSTITTRWRRMAQAKAKLFTSPGLRTAVINADDPFGQSLIDGARARGARLLTYGLSAGDIAASDIRMSGNGIALAVTTPWGKAEFASPMIGNVQCAEPARRSRRPAGERRADRRRDGGAGAAAASGGRMQRLGGTDRPLVVVDYAHTPDALEKVLTALRPAVAAPGELICVFGCGGDRDAGKRPEMGHIAARFADRIVVTTDNPRSEDPAAIANAVVRGVRDEGNRRWSIEIDRARRSAARSPPPARRRRAHRGQGPRDLPGARRRAHAIFGRRRGHRRVVDLDQPMMDTKTAARAVDGQLIGDNVGFRRVVTDSRALEAGDLFVALKGERFDGHEFVAAALAQGATAALVARPSRGALQGDLIAVPGSAGRARPPRGLLAREVRHAAGRHRRQQRQDDGQGNDGGDLPRAFRRRRRAGHAGQPQQCHRVAADAAPHARHASRGGGRARHEPSRRDDGTGRDRAADDRDRQQRAARTSGIHEQRRGGGRRARRRDPRAAPARNRRHQCRRRACRHVARCRTHRRRGGGRFRLPRLVRRVRALHAARGRQRHRAAHLRRQCTSRIACAGAAHGQQCAGGDRRRARGAAAAGRHRARTRCVPPGGRTAGRRSMRSPARWSSTTPTTRIRIPCAPPSTCWPMRQARSGWCWATWAKSARKARRSTRKSARMPRSAASSACSRPAS